MFFSFVDELLHLFYLLGSLPKQDAKVLFSTFSKIFEPNREPNDTKTTFQQFMTRINQFRFITIKNNEVTMTPEKIEICHKDTKSHNMRMCTKMHANFNHKYDEYIKKKKKEGTSPQYTINITISIRFV